MARKLTDEELLEEEGSVTPSGSDKTDGKAKKEKRKVVVINVPKKKKPMRTPTHIIRITMIWCFLIVLLLLTYPFLQVTFYITENMDVTPYAENAYRILATQDEIDACEKELQKALDGLEEAPEEEESSSAISHINLFPEELESAENKEKNKSSETTQNSQTSQSSQTSQAQKSSGGIRSMDSVYYNWSYYIAEGINADKLEKLIDECKQLDKDKYTEESIEKLNEALLIAQKALCASVFVSQNALQMMLGGSIGEAFGSAISLGDTFLRGLFAFALGVLPMIAVFALVLDKRRIVKNIIVLAACILVLLDIFSSIYPFIGVGAVLSIVMYIIIFVINFFGIYARQQEKYIVNHPELEAEFTEKHPHFVKALINQKSFGSEYTPSRHERDREAAKNAKRRQSKKKRK